MGECRGVRLLFTFTRLKENYAPAPPPEKKGERKASKERVGGRWGESERATEADEQKVKTVSFSYHAGSACTRTSNSAQEDGEPKLERTGAKTTGRCRSAACASSTSRSSLGRKSSHSSCGDKKKNEQQREIGKIKRCQLIKKNKNIHVHCCSPSPVCQQCARLPHTAAARVADKPKREQKLKLKKKTKQDFSWQLHCSKVGRRHSDSAVRR